MLLGKRLRNPMKRTTSMTEFDLQQPSLRSTSITGATETEIERVIDANSDQQLVLGNEDGVRLYQQQQPSSHPHPFLSEISNYHPSCYNNSANQPKQLNQGQEIEAEQGSKIDQYLHREQQKQLQPEHMMMMRPVGRAIQRRHSADYGQTTMRRIDETCDNGSNFLRSCSLCDLRLVPGRDIYMYRGDTAFCSLECRQQQMSDDQKKSIRRPRPASSSTATATKAESKTGSSSSRRETSPSTTAGSASCQSQTVAAV